MGGLGLGCTVGGDSACLSPKHGTDPTGQHNPDPIRLLETWAEKAGRPQGRMRVQPQQHAEQGHVAVARNALRAAVPLHSSNFCSPRWGEREGAGKNGLGRKLRARPSVGFSLYFSWVV